MESSDAIKQAAAIRQLIANSQSLMWHRHGFAGEYSLTVVSRDGRQHHTDGHLELLHLLLDACGAVLTRRCSNCHRDRVLRDFSGGIDRWCRECRKLLAREYRQKKKGLLIEKYCSRCGENKTRKQFSPGNRWCKKCRKEFMKEWRRQQ